METSLMAWSALLFPLVVSGLQLAVPVMLASTGELFAERSGVLNIGIEGTCLLGALTGFLVAWSTGSLWAGMAAAALMGVVSNAFLAWMYVTVQASQVVVGIIFNLLAFASASYAYRLFMGGQAGVVQVELFQPVHWGGLSELPVVGPLLFQQIGPFYLVAAFIVLSYFVLFHTAWGLSLRAVGENPRAAEASGIRVARMRYAAVLIGGGAAGLAGAYLVLGRVGIFRDNVVIGQGFIALAVVILGRWHPFKAALAALAFGMAEALQLLLQARGSTLPTQLLLSLPYLMTFIAISGLLGRANQPAALLKPHLRE